ncbi:MAG TPA: ABC transporter permease subunit [Caulobacterales bacterium]|nr:ABC transporter permease subunit [Caulobacterales bacterium]
MSDSVAAATAAKSQPPGRSPWREALARLLHDRAALGGLAVIALMVAAAALGAGLWPHKADVAFHDRLSIAPTFANLHWLGTDAEGRDVGARLLLGTGITWLAGALAALVSLIIGVAWGAIAGLSAGPIDGLMTRIVRGLAVIPLLFFVILLVVVTPTDGPEQDLLLVAGAIGATQWLEIARVMRDRTSALRRIAYVEAARAAGASRRQIVFRHIVPNIAGDVLVLAMRRLKLAILTESFLSFLGVGVKAPLASLGLLIAQGAREMETAPWTLMAPALVLAVMLIAVSLAADGLRDALEARER